MPTKTKKNKEMVKKALELRAIKKKSLFEFLLYLLVTLGLLVAKMVFEMKGFFPSGDRVIGLLILLFVIFSIILISRASNKYRKANKDLIKILDKLGLSEEELKDYS